MTEKEFRKLGMDDLVEILMVQNDEVLRLQGELDRRKEELASFTGHNDRLKKSLDERDAETEALKVKLNESDARIHEMEREIETSKLDQWIALDELGSITEAARNLDAVFAEAQKDAEVYLSELMDEINPRVHLKTDTARQVPRRKTVRKSSGRIRDWKETEESIEDIERRYLGGGAELLLEDVEDIEKRYRDCLY